MRTSTVDGRMALWFGGGLVDVESASGGAVPADPIAAFERWDDVRAWAAALDGLPSGVEPVPASRAGAPSPTARQVFAIGLNYADHVAESGLTAPEAPATFTKFASSLAGPREPLRLPSGFVDWEAELVVVIGRRAHQVGSDRAWDHVAGLTLGQDYSERQVQLAGPAPQYSLGKSYPGFAPTGPLLVTPDELADPDDLAISCTINGDVVQKSRTSHLLFPVRELIARLSAVCTLLPGDLIFTGTPAGVGMSRTPPRYLAPGDEVVTEIEGLGQMSQLCV